MKKTTFGVVGLGHIGKRHADLLNMNPDTELVALSDIRPSSELNISKHLNIPFYSSLGKMLESTPQMDVVCIATPNGLHASQAIEVLKAVYPPAWLLQQSHDVQTLGQIEIEEITKQD